MIRILLVDDHHLVRRMLSRLLSTERGFEIVGEADSGEESIRQCETLRPNIVLMDVSMPGIGGIEATRRITRLGLDIRVIALSACCDSPIPMQMLSAGAKGYLTKGVPPEELIKAVRRVFLNKRYVSSDIAQSLAFDAFEPDRRSPFEVLSAREMQIMMMVINCHKVSQISGNLHLSPKTVNSYRYRIFEKLHVSSDVELALMAVRYGLLDPQQVALNQQVA